MNWTSFRSDFNVGWKKNQNNHWKFNTEFINRSTVEKTWSAQTFDKKKIEKMFGFYWRNGENSMKQMLHWNWMNLIPYIYGVNTVHILASVTTRILCCIIWLWNIVHTLWKCWNKLVSNNHFSLIDVFFSKNVIDKKNQESTAEVYCGFPDNP